MAPLDEDHVRAKITWSEQDVGGGKLVVEVTVKNMKTRPKTDDQLKSDARANQCSVANRVVRIIRDVALSPSFGPSMRRRVSRRALYWRRVIHLRTLKISGISSWCSCQTNRLQTICSKRRTSVFGALGPIRTRESNLKPWAMSSWSRQLTSI